MKASILLHVRAGLVALALRIGVLPDDVLSLTTTPSCAYTLLIVQVGPRLRTVSRRWGSLGSLSRWQSSTLRPSSWSLRAAPGGAAQTWQATGPPSPRKKVCACVFTCLCVSVSLSLCVYWRSLGCHWALCRAGEAAPSVRAHDRCMLPRVVPHRHGRRQGPQVRARRCVLACSRVCVCL